MKTNEKDFFSAIANKIPIKLEQVVEIQSNWNDFINMINRGYKTPQTEDYRSQYNQDLMIEEGTLRFYDKLTLIIDKLEKHSVKEFKPIQTFLNKFEIKFRTAFGLISFTAFEKGTGRHQDNTDVVYLQVIGSVNWHIWLDDKEIDIKLSAGDAMFMPANIYHEVSSLTPRAGITFTISNI
jgi:ribosomal protein L16 Arg81 hydroxylase